MTALQFGTGVASAIAVKLTSSIDDVLWLSCFLSPSAAGSRLKNALTYAIICLLQTSLAYLLSRFGSSIVDDILGGSDSERLSTDRLLTLVAGGALLLYSIVLGMDYYKENYNGDDDEYGQVQTTDAPEETTTKKTTMEPLEIEKGLEEEEGTEYERSDKQSRPLAIIAFLGSLDDLTLFVPLLVGKALTIVQLILGALIATLMIIGLCVFLTQCRGIANLLEKIPLVAIVLGFSIVLLTKGTFFMD